MSIDDQIKHCRDEIKLRGDRIAWLESHRTQMESAGVADSVGFGLFTIDFDNLPHEKIVAVLRAFPGKYAKKLKENQTIDYTSEQPVDGFSIRCWEGQPPPSCKIVEVDEDVPAQPATKRKVKRLVCNEGVAA